MPAPRTVHDLPVIPHLPAHLRHVAYHAVTCPRSSSDHLLLLAEAFEELIVRAGLELRTARAVRTLITELRRRAPEYA